MRRLAIFALVIAAPAAAQMTPYAECLQFAPRNNGLIDPDGLCDSLLSKPDASKLTVTKNDYRNTPAWKDYELRALTADIDAKRALDNIVRDARLRRSGLRP